MVDEKELDPKLLKNRDAVIVDDIISTGETIAETCKVLKKYGSGNVCAMCIYALLIGDSANKIKAAEVDQIIATILCLIMNSQKLTYVLSFVQLSKTMTGK